MDNQKLKEKDMKSKKAQPPPIENRLHVVKNRLMPF
jgi:hypothetical protein